MDLCCQQPVWFITPSSGPAAVSQDAQFEEVITKSFTALQTGPDSGGRGAEWKWRQISGSELSGPVCLCRSAGHLLNNPDPEKEQFASFIKWVPSCLCSLKVWRFGTRVSLQDRLSDLCRTFTKRKQTDVNSAPANGADLLNFSLSVTPHFFSHYYQLSPPSLHPSIPPSLHPSCLPADFTAIIMSKNTFYFCN